MCLNLDCINGTCIAGKCNCDIGFDGETCQVNLCDGFCKNDGICVPERMDDINSIRCQCSEVNEIARYHGEKCEIPGQDPCDLDPCQNGGTCSTISTANIQVWFIRRIDYFFSLVVSY